MHEKLLNFVSTCTLFRLIWSIRTVHCMWVYVRLIMASSLPLRALGIPLNAFLRTQQANFPAFSPQSPFQCWTPSRRLCVNTNFLKSLVWPDSKLEPQSTASEADVPRGHLIGHSDYNAHSVTDVFFILWANSVTTDSKPSCQSLLQKRFIGARWFLSLWSMLYWRSRAQTLSKTPLHLFLIHLQHNIFRRVKDSCDQL